MGITIEIWVGIMGHFFWPVTCTHMGKQLNPQPSHPGKVGGKSPPWDLLWGAGGAVLGP